MTDLLQKLRDFLAENGADAILINSTNEFLTEYNDTAKNSRAKLTGFTGSTGDCLVTKTQAFLFVDPRYHEQADKEVDLSKFTVVKLAGAYRLSETVVSKLNKSDVLLLVSTKNFHNFCEAVESFHKNVKYIDFDPLEESDTAEKVRAEVVPVEICRYDAEMKKEKVVAKLPANTTVAFTSPEDVSYFTNLRCFKYPYSSSVRAKILLNSQIANFYTDMLVPELPYTVKPLSEFANDLDSLTEGQLLVDTANINQHDFMHINSGIKVKPAALFSEKSEKNPSEIKHIISAFEATDRVMAKVDAFIAKNDDISELDLYKAVEKFFRLEGAKGLSFNSITASGKNTSVIHFTHPDENKKIQNGDLVLVDIGGYFEGGFATDITRTFVKGMPDEKQKKIYTKVLKAFIAAYTAEYTKDTTWYEVDKVARFAMEESDGYVFSHALGHGIGLSVHENPPICAPSPKCIKKFKKNYVFSIEPGLYKAGENGVRLETAVYVKSVSPKFVLSALSHYKFEEKLINTAMLTEKELKFLEAWQKNGNQLRRKP